MIFLLRTLTKTEISSNATSQISLKKTFWITVIYQNSSEVLTPACRDDYLGLRDSPETIAWTISQLRVDDFSNSCRLWWEKREVLSKHAVENNKT